MKINLCRWHFSFVTKKSFPAGGKLLTIRLEESLADNALIKINETEGSCAYVILCAQELFCNMG